MWHLTQHRLNKRNFKTDGSKEMSDVIRAIKMSRGGGEGTQQSFRMGGSARDSTPHPFMTFLTENVPLSYTYLPGSLSTAVNSLP